MKELTPEQVQANYDRLIEWIKDSSKHGFSQDRIDKLLKLYGEFEERITMMPASGKEHFHSCFVGGYVHHVLNVIRCAEELHELWIRMGQFENYEYSELMFVALNHDIGKLGDLDNELYVPVTEDWKRKRGEMYDTNTTIKNVMPHQDRALWFLQEYDIRITENEFIGIRLHDGLYNKGNEEYLVSWYDSKQIKNNLPYIIHQADMMAMRIEYQDWKFGEKNIKVLKSGKQSAQAKAVDVFKEFTLGDMSAILNKKKS
jgi:hypothetical protein